jgi:tetratricopeptide (TPR) repeat protein
VDYWRVRELLNGGSVGSTDSVGIGWLQLSRVAESEPAALDLLRLMAFVAPAPFPLELILDAGPDDLGPRLRSVIGDPDALAKLIGALRGYCLASTDGEGLRVEEPLQARVRHDLGRQQATAWAERAARLVLNALPAEPFDSRQWEWMARLKPHAVLAAHHTEQAGGDQAWRLLTAVGIYLGSRGGSGEELHEALQCLSKACALAERRYGPDGRQVGFILKALGPVSFKLEDTVSARRSLERALRIEQAPADFRAPDYRTVAALNNHGLVLLDQGDAPAALDRVREALAIGEAIYGPRSRVTAGPLRSLGMVLRELHDLAGARDALGRAFQNQRTAYGPDHIEIAHTQYALAGVLHDQGDLEGASAALEDALRIFENAYRSPHHRQVIAVLFSLAVVNLKRRRLKDAWRNMRRIRLLEVARRAA